MIKEINELLKRENAYLKLNNCCRLHRWKKDALNGDVDYLMAEFSIERAFDYRAYISSRDWRGIIDEVIDAYQRAFEYVGKKLSSELRSGYIFSKEVIDVG